ncbi:MAG TPA: type IV secretion system DNA-binding domain-containing protein [Thermoleophilaceae bacterium]|nr:type IV secretion system DNA-binding domain-containing protein [Thermoleophilaceae bacterium]
MRSGELAPALVAAGGGGALLGAIAIHEHRRDRAMRSSRLSYSAVFPVGTEPEAAVSALESFWGLGFGFELVAEVVADESSIHHLLHVPESGAGSVIDHLAAAIPGLRLDPVDARSTGPVTSSLRFVAPAQALLRTDDPVQSSRSLLSRLAALRDGERVSLRWALRPSVAPPAPVAQAKSLKARAEQRAWTARVASPGFTAAGLLLVRAHSKTRAGELSRHVTSVVRSRRGVGRGLLIRRGSVRSTAAMPITGRTRGWLSAAEVLPLLGWPLGKEPLQGVEIGAARRLPVPRELPREGRALFVGRDPYGERPVVLTPEAARHHAAVVGPSGTGKSTLLTRSILQDIEAGYGGVVIDPKADLVTDVLERVSGGHAERLVVLNPTSGEPVPGLDLLGVGDPDLRSDVVLGALGAIFKDSWGVRTDTYLRLGLRTLSDLPSPVLTDWLRLFTDARFRHRAVGQLTDPLLVGAWQSYEGLTAAEQNQHVAAPMSKVISLLSRPAVRGVLAQRNPKLDIGRLLAERKWLLVSLSPGTLGEPASKLLGAILTYAIWTAIEERASLPRDKRRPVFLYMDELQSLAHLPFGVEYLFERARGLGCGVTVALQTTSRLPESIRQSMLGNVGSLVTFRLGYDEATRLARELPGLGAEDLQALRQFEVAARIGTGVGSGVATVTGRTEPPPPSTGQSRRIRELSAERYGQQVEAIDAELRSHQQADDLADEALGRTRRSS